MLVDFYSSPKNAYRIIVIMLAEYATCIGCESI